MLILPLGSCQRPFLPFVGRLVIPSLQYCFPRSFSVSHHCTIARFFFSLTFLAVTCLARYTAVMIVLSTLIGGVALSAQPITAGTKLLFRFVSDRLSILENYFAQRADTLQTLLKDSKTLLPIWIEEEWCEVTQRDDFMRLSGDRPALRPPPPLGKEISKSPPLCVLPKVTFEVQPQVQKPDFDHEGWLLV